jgi:putative redox protein
MMGNQTRATVHYAGHDLFIGISPSGHAVTMDTNHERDSAPTPVELLLVALGACTAVDVIGILEKKREIVTDYHVEIHGERRDEHPRSYRQMTVHHVVKGRNVSPRAVAQAIELSESKYCSVAANLRPTTEIHSTFETVEDDGQ